MTEKEKLRQGRHGQNPGQEPLNRVIWAPNPFTADEKYPRSIFLSGYISSTYPTWRESLTSSLQDLPLTILNPCRSTWDWEESISDPAFVQQANWELSMLSLADLVVVVFPSDPEIKGAITLLELGLMMGERGGEGVVVVCPEGYWKRGNVQVVCKRYGAEVLSTVGELDKVVREKLVELEKDQTGYERRLRLLEMQNVKRLDEWTAENSGPTSSKENENS
ncbi:hypothetical protein B0O99DRAFT_606841 [Bisporella sp. PMI_857]|nr:hypothetical protein B0O99DRAFT_606841 [Bisporella sp. PMI_857]